MKNISAFILAPLLLAAAAVAEDFSLRTPIGDLTGVSPAALHIELRALDQALDRVENVPASDVAVDALRRAQVLREGNRRGEEDRERKRIPGQMERRFSYDEKEFSVSDKVNDEYAGKARVKYLDTSTAERHQKAAIYLKQKENREALYRASTVERVSARDDTADVSATIGRVPSVEADTTAGERDYSGESRLRDESAADASTYTVSPEPDSRTR